MEGPYTKLRNALHHRLHLIGAAGRGWPFLREAGLLFIGGGTEFRVLQGLEFKGIYLGFYSMGYGFGALHALEDRQRPQVI